jgi:succinyldiaminopimelate transaminase
MFSLVNEGLLRLPTYPMVRLDQLKAEVRARGLDVFDYGTGDPREPTPSFIREAMAAAVPEISQYPPVHGQPAMRRAAADYLARRFGLDVDPERELLPTQGSKEAIFHLPMVLVDPGAERRAVVYGVPAYPVFEIGARFAGAEVVEMPLHPGNRYLLDPAGVSEDVLARTAVVFLNYPHNPTGQLMPPELFLRWVAARDRFGFTLVSDECYVDLYYEDPPRCALEFGREGVLAVHSLSKRSGMTGYRSGFVAGDAELVAHYRRFRAGMGVAPTDPVQAAAEVAWRDVDHVAQRRQLFAEKRRILLELFAEVGLEVYPGTAGLFLWVGIPEGQTDQGYAELLLQRGIVVSPGSFFGPGQDRFIRLALVPGVEECRRTAALWPRPGDLA